ncbi:hypothetical protein AB0I28_15385 [Phytomonospora sp. NPDC050363]|uniref:hypothetical protein n=1 Tax=Phytomonospora sp. NPDC050363 TaxID=3155642 RepID=UPI0033C1E82B
MDVVIGCRLTGDEDGADCDVAPEVPGLSGCRWGRLGFARPLPDTKERRWT